MVRESYQEHAHEADEKTRSEGVDPLLQPRPGTRRKTQKQHQRGRSYKKWVSAESDQSAEKEEEKRELDLHRRERADSI